LNVAKPAKQKKIFKKAAKKEKQQLQLMHMIKNEEE
jgi:hypothetical protein